MLWSPELPRNRSSRSPISRTGSSLVLRRWDFSWRAFIDWCQRSCMNIYNWSVFICSLKKPWRWRMIARHGGAMMRLRLFWRRWWKGWGELENFFFFLWFVGLWVLKLIYFSVLPRRKFFFPFLFQCLTCYVMIVNILSFCYFCGKIHAFGWSL